MPTEYEPRMFGPLSEGDHSAGWESYRKNVMPANASRVQVDETRNGFYAGAAHLFSTIMTDLDPGAEETDADLQLLDGIHDELKAFAHSKRG